MRRMTKAIRALLITAAAALFPAAALADFPERTVKIVVPFDAGGTVEGFEKFLKDDIEFYRRLAQAAGLTPE